ncbi:hypothetical protein [Gordonia zhaorongruii]|uniref:hypothetical protein n=1 Tax=Gordonia zhaorongruii TaxID=2597659 RepID=UPI00117D596D|nr:hypothetical protein [Gordonia zhaorongruii]
MTGSATLQDNEIDTCISARLGGVDLLVEANPTRDELTRAQQRFGAVVGELPAGAHLAVISRNPALTIAALVWHAALREDAATDFWAGFADAAGIDRDPALEAAVTDFAGDMLTATGLRDVEALRSPNAGAPNLLPLLELHAGLPDHAVGTLIDVIERHVAAGREPSGTAVLDYLTEPGFEHRQAQLPGAFRALLDHAPDVAVTILARLCAALVASVAQPVTWSPHAMRPSNTDLPPTILDTLIARLERASFLDGNDGAVELCTGRSPVLRYDAAEGTLNVVVPAGDEAATWRAWAGDAPEQVTVGAGEAALVPVTSALRECVLVNLDSGARRSLPVLVPGDPVVLFAPDGRSMSRHRTLPPGEVLALVPNDAQFTGSQGRAVTVVDSEAGPWDGWLLCTLDLAGHREFTVTRDGRAGQTRRVRPIESPSIELPDALPGITTREGDPVFGERPLVDLPAHAGDDVKEWRVRVRRAGDLEWMVDCPWASADYITSADPFDGIYEPLLGRYVIAVSDSYGLDLRRVAVVVEGLDAAHDPAVRLPSEEGLAESVTTFTVDADAAEAGLAVDADEVEFGPGDAERPTGVTVGDQSLRLVVRPPHALVRIERPGAPAAWQTSLAVIDVAAADHRRIAVYVPGAVDASFALLDADLDIVREWDAEERSGAEFALSTRSIVDASRRLTDGTLVALIADEEGETEEAPVATIVRDAPSVPAGEPSADTTVGPLTAEWMRLDAVLAAEAGTGDDDTVDTLEAAASAPADEILAADPTASLIALGDSPVAPARIPAMLIRSGLGEQPFVMPDGDWSFHPNPYIGCTLATAAIVDPSHTDHDEIQAYLTGFGGDELLRLLATGRMSDPRTGVFDRNVLAVDSMSREQVDMLFEHFRLVPGPVLDLDMRTSATIDAFHQRADWMAHPVSLEASRHVNTMLRDVRRSSPQMYDLIAARNEALDRVDTGSNPWMLLSMQSMTFAAIARLQAYGQLKKGELTDEGRAMWAVIADYFPGMVAADLLIANAVAVRAGALAAQA